MKILSPRTVAWCVKRGHPWVTYNPVMHRTWCRCGERQQAGEAPQDWKAMWEISSGHDECGNDPCRCYENHLEEWQRNRLARRRGAAS